MKRAEEVQNRIADIEQIGGVVNAMRGLAAAHVRDADKHLSAIRAYEATIGEAIAEVLLLTPERATGAPEHANRRLTIVVGAEQGFSGAYSDAILETALPAHTEQPEQDFILIGRRCISEFPATRKAPLWTGGMAPMTSGVPALASRIVDALFAQLETGVFREVCIIFGQPAPQGYEITEHRIVPFDYSRFNKPLKQRAPLILMPAKALIESLVEEYVFSEICEALMLGFAAENDARMAAMTRARQNIKRTHKQLVRKFHQLRQEETTNEIIELSSSLR